MQMYLVKKVRMISFAIFWWALNQRTRVLVRNTWKRDKQERKAHEDRIRDWSYAARGQGTPGVSAVFVSKKKCKIDLIAF